MTVELGQPVLPKVLVVLGNYKQSNFIADAIHSIRNQSYPHFKCVIVDDCSGDGSDLVIEELLSRLGDDRFCFAPTPENLGQMGAMIHGLSQVDEGEFVAFIDADDFWREDYLLCHVAMHLNPVQPVAVTCSNMTLVDEGKCMQGIHVPLIRQDARAVRLIEIDSLFNRDNILQQFAVPFDVAGRLITDPESAWNCSATSGAVFRRAALEATLPSKPSTIRICADSYWVQAAHYLGGTIWIQSPLGYYRIHGSNGFSFGKLTGIGGLRWHSRQGVAEAIKGELDAWIARNSDLLKSKGRLKPLRRLKTVEELRMREPKWLFRGVASVFKRYLRLRDWLRGKKY
ncbi:glycosyltransferase [Pseudovibrio sp. SPO723]|uniref:glycosyltransferase n=1 Tax=Nesiotobacter zosterae TaxID=392721 RepID=UPI0029C559E1|nr:glycosyltransferase [Pseudovibrio sp. SPO723]MDX5594910.1 glycosyltransferase [Pseudovibrio sp. SPO723]